MQSGLLAAALLATQPSMAAGLDELSEHFAIRQVSGVPAGAYQEVFARNRPQEPFGLIGTTMPGHWDKPFSGPELRALEASVIALASDGKTLLYWHRHLSRSFGAAKAEGIYRFRVGEGETLLFRDHDLAPFWQRFDKPLPRHVMAVKTKACAGEALCALDADDGSLTPLAMLGSSALHRAAYDGDLEGVRSALRNQVPVDGGNYWGYTALEIAVRKDREDIALAMLAAGADERHQALGHPTPLQLAVNLRRWQLLQALQPKLADPALLRYALPRSYARLMADDTRDHQPQDLPRLVRLLLDAGLDPAQAPEPVILRLLETRTLRGSQVLLDTLELLLERGARADQADPESLQTPLHHVTADTDWRLVDGAGATMKLLLSRMKTLEARDRFGLTALQDAMLMPDRGDGLGKAMLLIEAGADDSVEYRCGVMRHASDTTVKAKLAEWQGVVPRPLTCDPRR